jgi:hypothetical protein
MVTVNGDLALAGKTVSRRRAVAAAEFSENCCGFKAQLKIFKVSPFFQWE